MLLNIITSHSVAIKQHPHYGNPTKVTIPNVRPDILLNTLLKGSLGISENATRAKVFHDLSWCHQANGRTFAFYGTAIMLIQATQSSYS